MVRVFLNWYALDGALLMPSFFDKSAMLLNTVYSQYSLVLVSAINCLYT